MEIGGNVFINNFPKYVSEVIGSGGVARRVLCGCGVIFRCCFPGGLMSKRGPRFFGPPAESCVAAALGDMLLYFGADVLSNVTENPQFLQRPREGLKLS